jgi:uncharacterized protein (TIGR03437 family)
MVFYATGEGSTDPAGVEGKPAALPLPHPLLPATLTVGGRPAKILYIGGAPGLVAGALQINAQLDDNTPSGPNVEVTLTIGSASSPPGVTVSVQ